MKAGVNKIIPFSSVDGPGNRTAIFFQGCNFDCSYCHNPETINICNNCGECIEVCPVDALSREEGVVSWNHELCEECDRCIQRCPRNSSPRVRQMSVNQIIDEIEKTRPFISGITVSGGEVLLQTEFVQKLFYEVKNMGLSCFVDTNGSVSLWEREELVKVMDKAMVDLKSFNKDEHKRLTGHSNETVIKNIKFLAEYEKLYEVRTVIVPELLNNKRNVDMTSKLITSLDKDIRYKLIKFRPKGVRSDRVDSQVPTDKLMEELERLAENNGCENLLIV